MERTQGRVRIATIGGFSIHVHYSWLLIATLIFLGFWGQLQVTHETLGSPQVAALATFGTFVFFGSVLIHELAHALIARRRGIEVGGITLFLFGGVTEANAASRSAGDEFVIAIAGPLTSLLLAVVLAIAAAPFGTASEPLPDLLFYLATINVLLALFNMAPGLPLDGGRVFRSIVWGVTGDFDKATRWATSAGVAIGYGLIGGGLFAVWQGAITGLWLSAIGWMIAQSARQSQTQDGLRSSFEGVLARDVMSSPVVTIPGEATVATAVRDYFATHDLTAFPVVDGDRIWGLLTVAAVRAVPAGEVWKSTAAHVVFGGPPTTVVEPTAPMLDVLDAMANNLDGKARVLVVDDGRLVGIISPSDIVRRQAMAELLASGSTDPAQVSDWRR